MTSRRSVALPVLLLVFLVLVTSGCSFWDKGADARDAAEKFATAMEKGDVGAIEFTDPKAPQELTALTKTLDHATTVSVDQVTRSGDTANVRLNWTVDVDGHSWKHQTSAKLVDHDGEWQVEWKPSIVEKSLEAGETFRVSRVKAERGAILGRDDAPIVIPRAVVRFGIDRTQVPAAAAPDAARRLAVVLDIAVAPYVDQVTKAGPKAFVQAIVLRRNAVSTGLLGRVEAIRGARALSDHLPLAPSREFAAAILGTVGPATKEIIEKSDGRLHVGDDAGLSGLQLRYDEQLGGTPGIKVSAVPAADKADATDEETDEETDDETEDAGEPRTLFEVEPTAGEALHTTLDPRLQQRADDLLAGVGPASAVVAIQPSSGAILAAASGPGSDGYNTATFGQYAPGSTYKVVSALALLRSGLTPASPVSCTPTITVNGKQFKNYSDYPSGRLGRISLRDALANSCNTGFISQHDRLKGADLADAAAALGFGVDHDLGFPAYFGQVPPPAGETEGAADMIGQGKVLASPMAMAAVVASVAKGETVVPELIADEAGADAEASPEHPLTSAEAGRLRSMMRAVVTEGSGVLLRSLQPPAVIAKTGTAEYGAKAPLPTHAWMIAAQGDLAVAVFVATGESGSRTAGPILRDFLASAR
jgi:cell division protein FtsI/penicillin-binding protein 2